jgi:hypothetical protein
MICGFHYLVEVDYDGGDFTVAQSGSVYWSHNQSSGGVQSGHQLDVMRVMNIVASRFQSGKQAR